MAKEDIANKLNKKEETRKQSVVNSIVKEEAEIPQKGRPKVNRETKKRRSIAVFLSKYDQIGKIAYVDRTSISEIVDNFFDEYIEQNQDKIKEYDKLKG